MATNVSTVFTVCQKHDDLLLSVLSAAFFFVCDASEVIKIFFIFVLSMCWCFLKLQCVELSWPFQTATQFNCGSRPTFVELKKFLLLATMFYCDHWTGLCTCDGIVHIAPGFPIVVFGSLDDHQVCREVHPPGQSTCGNQNLRKKEKDRANLSKIHHSII